MNDIERRSLKQMKQFGSQSKQSKCLHISVSKFVLCKLKFVFELFCVLNEKQGCL